MKKWLVRLFAIAAVGGLAYVGYIQLRGWHSSLRDAQEDRPTTAVVIQTNISFSVNAAGEIGPAEQVSVRPEINGRIEELPVDIGDRVKKGDLLFKLDDKELQQQRASSITAVERAKLELEKAERDYLRAKELLEANLISRELYDDTKTAYDLAKNSLERAKRELALIDERLTKTKVVAPFDCTVLT
ncbi:MAG: efflux RND transporter periplasmic adaptor subunit, partial [Verrucomicrobiae bacterium]|nr:efflux RND transporter periplasmic adaptor subunit [Verrucomicrobiae bacterium]